MSIAFLQLKNFRNHQILSVESAVDFVRIIGENGCGKTNILEAISFLSPGKGLRSAGYHEAMNNASNDNLWSVECAIVSKEDKNILRSAYMDGEKKFYSVNDNNVKSAMELLQYLRVVWLTPKLDGIFSDSASARRNFFDRLCYNVYPTHASDINVLNRATQSRNKLLKAYLVDEYWLNSYEKIIVDKSLQIAKTRAFVLAQLSDALEDFNSAFIRPKIAIICKIQEALDSAEFSGAKAQLLEELQKNRQKDKFTGRTSIGAHRSNFEIKHYAKNILADMCSTGEQKAMIIATIVAHLHCVKKNFNGPIVLMLDDIFSHLDDNNKRELLKELQELKIQTWITSTDDFDQLFARTPNTMKLQL